MGLGAVRPQTPSRKPPIDRLPGPGSGADLSQSRAKRAEDKRKGSWQDADAAPQQAHIVGLALEKGCESIPIEARAEVFEHQDIDTLAVTLTLPLFGLSKAAWAVVRLRNKRTVLLRHPGTTDIDGPTGMKRSITEQGAPKAHAWLCAHGTKSAEGSGTEPGRVAGS